MRKELRAAVKAMETTRGQTDPVRELRQWRLQAEKRFMGVIVTAAQAKVLIGQIRRGAR